MPVEFLYAEVDPRKSSPVLVFLQLLIVIGELEDSAVEDGLKCNLFGLYGELSWFFADFEDIFIHLYIDYKRWEESNETCPAYDRSASTAKNHLKTKSSSTTTKKPNISAVPSAPRSSPPSTPCCSTRKASTARTSSGCLTRISVVTAWH